MNRQLTKIALAIALVFQTTILLAQPSCSDNNGYSNGLITNFGTDSNAEVDAISGLYVSDRLGYDVSSIGDFNGDGIDDISLSATYATPSESTSADPSDNQIGEIYIIFGGENLEYDQFDLSSLNGSNGFKIPGVANRDRLGYGGGKGIGDINGDGFDDLVVSSPYPDPNTPVTFNDPNPVEANGFASGTSYIIFGNSCMPAVFDLALLDQNNCEGVPAGFSITGTHYYENIGTYAGPAGDFNNDGIDDFFVTSDDSWISGASVGALFLIYGKTTGFLPTYVAHEIGRVENDLDALVIVGDNSGGTRGDNFGITAAPLNDINGDGITDILIGASYANADKGGAYVIFGSDGVPPDATEFTIPYFTTDGSENYPVSMYTTDPGNTVMMINLSATLHDGTANPDVTVLDGTNGFAILGTTVNAGFGTVTGDAGDFNNDGINDLYVCGYKEGGKGACYIIYGRNGNFADNAEIDLANLDIELPANKGLKIFGETANNFFGFSASSIGDFNGDSVDDIAIGAVFTGFNGLSASGSVYVIYGKQGGFMGNLLDLNNLDFTQPTPPTQGFRLDGEAANARLGFSIDGLFDLDGDHHKEIIIGSDFDKGCGRDDMDRNQSCGERECPREGYEHVQCERGKAYVLHSKCMTCAKVIPHLSDLHIECDDPDGATIVYEVGDPNNIIWENAPLTNWSNYYTIIGGYYYFENLSAFPVDLQDNNCNTGLSNIITEDEDCGDICEGLFTGTITNGPIFNKRATLFANISPFGFYTYLWKNGSTAQNNPNQCVYLSNYVDVTEVNTNCTLRIHFNPLPNGNCFIIHSGPRGNTIPIILNPSDGGGILGNLNPPKLGSITEDEITIQPNPTKGTFAIHFKELEIEEATLSIYNLAGTLVKESRIEANESIVLIDASTLSNGMYLVKVSTNSGEQLFSDKLTIAH